VYVMLPEPSDLYGVVIDNELMLELPPGDFAILTLSTGVEWFESSPCMWRIPTNHMGLAPVVMYVK